MSIFSDDHLDTAQGSAGPRTGFFEGVTTGFNQQRVVDSELALEMEIYERWQETLDAYERQTGNTLMRFSPDQLVAYRRNLVQDNMATAADIAPLGFLGGFFTGASPVRGRTDEAFAAIQEQSDAFRAAGLPGFDEIFAEVQKLQQDTERATAEVSATGGLSGTLGQIVGGIGGSFTTRDPTSLVFGLAGGGGRTAATRILTEAALGGGTEAFLQYGPVAQNRKLAGLPEGNKLENVLFATGGAAALGTLFEGLRFVGRRVEQSGPQDIAFDFEDAQLREMLGQLPDSPRTRAALDMLDDDAEFAAASPYGTSYQGLRRFNAEVAEAEMALLGRTDTAIGFVPVSDLPLSVREREEDFTIVREISPEVAARYDTAKARLEDIDTSLSGVAAEVENMNAIDAVRLVSEEAADALETLAARTDIPEEAKLLEAEIIFNRVGKDVIMNAVETREISLRRTSQRLRKQRKAANKEYKQAVLAMDLERAKLLSAADKVKAMMQGEVTDLMGYALQTRSMQGSKLSAERVVAQRDAIVKDADTLAERAETALNESITPSAGPVKVTELAEGVGEMGKAVADGYVQMLFARARGGHVTDVNGTTLPSLQALKMISDAGVKLSRALTERVVRNTDRLTSKGDQFAADMRSIVMDEVNQAQGLLEIAPGVWVRADFMIPDESGELVPVGGLIKDFDEDARLVEAMRSCAL